MNIAILGSTGNIARGLRLLFDYNNHILYKFSRSAKTDDLVTNEGYYNISTFNNHFYDVIINCTGNGFIGKDIFGVTEYYDDLIFKYLVDSPKTIVISFSSGVVGRFSSHGFLETDYYTIAKLNSEAKHRASKYTIIDIRLYSSFCHTNNLDQPYFINDVIRHIKTHTIYKTNEDKLIRDYISMADLFSLIQRCIIYNKNVVFEAYTLASVSKFEILEKFKEKFGLAYDVSNYFIDNPYTGKKLDYTPIFKDAESIGYQPTMTSLENLIKETELILK